MRRISILAIVVLLLVVVELVAGMFGTWDDNNGTKYIKATMADIEKPAEGRYYSSEVILRVYPLNPETAQIGEAYNLESQCEIPFIASRIRVGCWLPFWVKVMEYTLSLVTLPFLIGELFVSLKYYYRCVSNIYLPGRMQSDCECLFMVCMVLSY